MPDLLSASQVTQIRNAIRDVTDTFYQLPVTYHERGESLDRFGEDKADQKETDHNLLGFLEYETSGEGGELMMEKQGSIDFTEATLFFNYDDLDDLGLIDTEGLFKGNSNKDYVTIQGQLFRLKSPPLYEGLLKTRHVLIGFIIMKEEKNA